MMTPPRRRALTLIELMLALAVTVMVAGAIASMMAAVNTGVGTRRDVRSVMVRANAAQMRVAGYIVPACCLLSVDQEDVVVWFSDSRESGTVHGSEIRWLLHDADAGTLSVSLVSFPDGWTQTQKELADAEHPVTSNWTTVLSSYDAKGLIRTIVLVDGLASLTVTPETDALNSRTVHYDFGFETAEGVQAVRVSPVVRIHQAPSS
jgi:hypothetical protein